MAVVTAHGVGKMLLQADGLAPNLSLRQLSLLVVDADRYHMASVDR